MTRSFRIRRLIANASLLGLVAFSLSGCAGLLHKSVLQQGNIVNDQMVANLKPGMTPEQVLYVMGEPVLRNPFNPNRWDYVYTFEAAGKITQRRIISLFFEDGVLKYTLGHFAPLADDVQAQDAPESEES